MADLKLSRLPDRTPIKLALTLPPDLGRSLEEYRSIYNERFAADEPLSEIAVAMLAAFLGGDREFQKARAARKDGSGQSANR